MCITEYVPDCRNQFRVKGIHFLHIDGDTDTPCLGVNAERALKQVVESFSDVDI